MSMSVPSGWYHGGLSRADAEGKLYSMPSGTFLVRDSSSKKGDYVLTVKTGDRMTHYIITNGGTKLITDDNSFFNLNDLVEHYRKHAVLCLPVLFESGEIAYDSLSYDTVHQPNDHLFKVRCLYDFESDNQEDLFFKRGDELFILDDRDEHWWKARSGDCRRIGIIPVNYVEIIERSSISSSGNNSAEVSLTASPGSPPLIWNRSMSLSGSHRRIVQEMKLIESNSSVLLAPTEEEHDRDVCYEENGGRVKGGTLTGLVKHLTSDRNSDPSFMQIFLTTYRSFTTPDVLLEMLIKRYGVTYGGPIFRKTVQLKVCNALRKFLEGHFSDFSEQMLNRLEIFVFVLMQDGEVSYSRSIRHMLDKQRLDKTAKQIFSHPAPPSLLPSKSNKRQLVLFDIPAEEVARQITLVDAELFRAVRPNELLNYNKKAGKEQACNLNTMVARFNRMARWFASRIVETPKAKDRAKVLAYIIEVAGFLEKVNNFNSLMALMSSMNYAAIARLKFTEDLLDKGSKKKFDDLTKLMAHDGSYKMYRGRLHEINPPCVPMVAVYLKDLTFIDDGNKDFIIAADNHVTQNEDIINYEKRRFAYKVILEVQQYQQDYYNFSSVSAIINLFDNFSNVLSEDALYEMSLSIEPKNASRSHIK